MVITVIVSGVPRGESHRNLYREFENIFFNAEISSFRIRRVHASRGKPPVAIDFRSGFEAMAAQDMLDGYRYIYPYDNTVRVLKARILRDPDRAIDPSPSRTREMAASSKPEDLDFQAQLKILRQQVSVLEAQRRVLKEKRKLEKEFALKDDSEGECSTKRRKRRRERSASAVSDDTHRSKSSRRRRSRKESKTRKEDEEIRLKSLEEIKNKAIHVSLDGICLEDIFLVLSDDCKKYVKENLESIVKERFEALPIDLEEPSASKMVEWYQDHHKSGDDRTLIKKLAREFKDIDSDQTPANDVIWTPVKNDPSKRIKRNLPVPDNPQFAVPITIILRHMKRYVAEVEKECKPIYKIARIVLKGRFKELLRGLGYTRSCDIIDLYRKIYDRDNDEDFIKQLRHEIDSGKYKKEYEELELKDEGSESSLEKGTKRPHSEIAKNTGDNSDVVKAPNKGSESLSKTKKSHGPENTNTKGTGNSSVVAEVLSPANHLPPKKRLASREYRGYRWN